MKLIFIQAYKPSVTGVILSRTSTIHYHRSVMELLQTHRGIGLVKTRSMDSHGDLKLYIHAYM